MITILLLSGCRLCIRIFNLLKKKSFTKRMSLIAMKIRFKRFILQGFLETLELLIVKLYDWRVINACEQRKYREYFNFSIRAKKRDHSLTNETVIKQLFN